ncbi:MAG: hypothetical protein J6I73_03090 [Treponema sp.]|nr:hypothetical protein [Treponema sp.]
MKRKKSIAIAFFLSILFCILYLLLAARPLGNEYQFSPQWKLETNAQTIMPASNEQSKLYFRLGQTIGYFTDDGKLLSIIAFPFKAAISQHYYASFSANSTSFDFFNADGTKAGTIHESGFPFFDDDRIFVFLPGGASFIQCNPDGSRKWQFTGAVPITAFNSSSGGCAVGFADGIVRTFSPDGNITQEFAPGGSDYPVILGAAISSDGTMIATVSGQNSQRFVLLKKDSAQSKIILHQFIAANNPRQRLVQFSKDDSTVWYNFDGGLGIVDTLSGKHSQLALNGQAILLQESDDYVFVLTKEQATYTVYAIEKFSTIIGSFSFEARTAFIRTDGKNLFVGKDTTISRIVISKN